MKCPTCEFECDYVDPEYPYHYAFYTAMGPHRERLRIQVMTVTACVDGVTVTEFGHGGSATLPKNWIVM